MKRQSAAASISLALLFGFVHSAIADPMFVAVHPAPPPRGFGGTAARLYAGLSSHSTGHQPGSFVIDKTGRIAHASVNQDD